MKTRGFHLAVGLLEAGTAWYLFEAARRREIVRMRPWMSLASAAIAGVFAVWHLRQWRVSAPALGSAPAPSPAAPAPPMTTSPTPTTPLN